jgi:hypothetical protein
MVAPTQRIPDLGERDVRLLSEEIHSNLAGQGDLTGSFAAQHAIDGHPECFCHGSNNFNWRDFRTPG